jgi:hypothetical protein
MGYVFDGPDEFVIHAEEIGSAGKTLRQAIDNAMKGCMNDKDKS